MVMRLALLPLAGALACIAWAARPAAATMVTTLPGGAASLSARLSADRPSYVLGEPVTLTLTIANPTAGPIAIRRIKDAGTGEISVRIARGGGEFLRYVGPDFGIKHTMIQETPLAPGEQFSVPVRVLYNAITTDDGGLPYFYAFEQAGTYQIRAEVRDVVPGEPLVTNVVRVEMRAPSGTDAEVWTMLQREDAARFLHNGGSSAGARQADSFEQLLARYPSSVYAPGIRSSLALHEKIAPQGGAASGAATGIVDWGNRSFLSTTAPSASQTSADETARSIATLISAFENAWNARDAGRILQYLSRGNSIRQKWDQGEGDADRQRAAAQLDAAFAAFGTIDLLVVSTRIGAQSAQADLTLRRGAGQPQLSAVTMELVRDGGAWRILEVGF